MCHNPAGWGLEGGFFPPRCLQVCEQGPDQGLLHVPALDDETASALAIGRYLEEYHGRPRKIGARITIIAIVADTGDFNNT